LLDALCEGRRCHKRSLLRELIPELEEEGVSGPGNQKFLRLKKERNRARQEDPGD
jgi:hypothetical protein